MSLPYKGIRRETKRMRKLVRTLVLAAAAVPSLLACGGTEPREPDAVLATVEGSRITESMFREETERLPPHIRPLVDTPAGRMQFLESLISRDLLLREAVRRGFERRPEVRERLEQARRAILMETLLRDVSENLPSPSEEELRKYYGENQASFQTAERVRVRHILFREENLAEATARSAKKGVPFEVLMRGAQAAGATVADLGLIERGTYDRDFENAAFGASEPATVGPVKTMYGYHVIQVLERRPAGVAPFEEVRQRIATELRESAVREAFDTLVNGLKQNADIRISVSGEGPPSAPAPGEEKIPADLAGPPRGDR